MPEFALAAAGVIVFALATWASLAFGYQVFQNMWDTDQVDDPAPALLPTEDREIPLLAVDSTKHEARVNELVRPAAPTA